MSSREPNAAETPLVEPLTRREQEILTFLDEGFSAPEIAEQLTLAVSSVKWHIQQVYVKLGVNSKRQALNRARELRLLDTPLSPAERKSPAAPPPTPQHNLPVQLTNFIGRAQQIAVVKRLLRSTRLLTLIGPGGTGKTRLALQVAAEMLVEFPDGAWLVELAPSTQPAQVPQAAAQAMALRAESAELEQSAPANRADRDALSLILDHLRAKTVLLILDNCEHLVEACAQLAEQLLRAAPGLRILGTSREALRVTGERSYLVPALSVPEAGQLPALSEMAQIEAVRLFVERAAAVRPDFALTSVNARAVAQVCQRLDGIPLALELAAARVQALPVEQIATLLDDRLRLLTGGSRTAPLRQQTLRGAMDWSYDLLSDPERSLLQRLTVFAGGFTVAAAEHMLSAPDALDLLTQLVGKSLVLPAHAPQQSARFSLLETIREYAQERLVQAGEVELARDRHLAYYLAVAEEAEPELRGHGQARWLARLEAENDNLQGALAWAMQTKNPESAQRLAGALAYYWVIRCQEAEGRRWLDAALNLPTSHGAPGPSAWQARALLGAGWLDREKDLSASLSRLEKGLAIYRDLGNQAGTAYGQYLLGRHFWAQKDYPRALIHYQAALDLWSAAEDSWGMGLCLHGMGHATEEMADRAKARELYQRSVEILREEGDSFQLGGPLNDLARYAWLDGDPVRARAGLEEILAATMELGSQNAIAYQMCFLSSISAAQGDYDRARQEARSSQNYVGIDSNPTSLARLGEADYLQGHLVEAQRTFEAAQQGWRKQNDLHGQAWPLARMGGVAYRLGDLDRAARLLEQSLDHLGPGGWYWNRALVLLIQGDIARVRGQHAAAELYTHSLQLISRDLQEVADRLEGFAKLAGAAQQPQRAARLFGAAEALRQRLVIPIPPVEQADYDGAVALARAQLDPAAFDVAWAEGRALGWEQAATYALSGDAD